MEDEKYGPVEKKMVVVKVNVLSIFSFLKKLFSKKQKGVKK